MSINTLWIDDKYINLLSYQLDRFKRLNQYTYNFRCPICGDSKISKFKTRGYVYKNKNRLSFKCHNCGSNSSFSQFLKNINQEVYNEYKLEILKENRIQNSNIERISNSFVSKIDYFTNHEFNNFEPLKELKKVSDLDSNHPVKEYVNKRKIPIEYHNKLYFVIRFMEWVNKYIPNKFDNKQLKMDEPRLLIPFLDENGFVFAVSGRSFKKKSIRYMTIKFDENKPKIFGLDTLNKNNHVYVVEGPIDSMFIPNSIAMAGADIQLNELLPENNFTIIFDNEPRNLEIIKRMDKNIQQNNKICIWPDYINEKDINDMIINGKTKEEVIDIINENTYEGLKAKLRLMTWRKI